MGLRPKPRTQLKHTFLFSVSSAQERESVKRDKFKRQHLVILFYLTEDHIRSLMVSDIIITQEKICDHGMAFSKINSYLSVLYVSTIKAYRLMRILIKFISSSTENPSQNFQMHFHLSDSLWGYRT